MPGVGSTRRRWNSSAGRSIGVCLSASANQMRLRCCAHIQGG
jgi:hypothetical protein